jgi:GNAT superfamily N-acetyltransferase
MSFKIYISKNNLSAKEFIDLSKSVGWGKNRKYDLSKVEYALKKSSFIVTIRNEKGIAIGCGRALSDNMFFTTIPDIFVNPKYQGKGIGKIVMNKIINKYSHTKIYFGSQPGNEKFFEKLGFKKDLQSYAMKK